MFLILTNLAERYSVKMSISRWCFSFTAIAEPINTNHAIQNFLITSVSGIEAEKTYLATTLTNKVTASKTRVNALNDSTIFLIPLFTLLNIIIPLLFSYNRCFPPHSERRGSNVLVTLRKCLLLSLQFLLPQRFLPFGFWTF